MEKKQRHRVVRRYSSTGNKPLKFPFHLMFFGNTYKPRVSAVNRLGSQSDWVVYDVDAFPAIPDLSDVAFGATVTHANQPDGTQLIIVGFWDVSDSASSQWV